MKCSKCGEWIFGSISAHQCGPRGCGGGRSNGNSFGPDRVKRGWRMILLEEAQVTFWKLI